MRRRLTAAAIAAGVLLLIIVLFAKACGGSGDPASSAANEKHTKKAPPPLAAKPPAKPVRVPTSINGTGAFIQVQSGVSDLVDAARPGKGVALTFDDGPGPQTGQFLAALQKLRAKASFFLMGEQVQQSPETVKELQAAGMTLGNHTWNHADLTSLSPAEQRKQFEDTQNAIEQVVGYKPFFWRPPQWSWDGETAAAGADLGMIGVLNTYDSEDWKLPGTQAIVDAALQAQAGSVIAFHDAGGDRTETLQALPAIVRGLREKGLEPVTLDELYRGNLEQ